LGEGAPAIAEDGAPHVVFDAEYFRNRDPDEIRDAIWHMLGEAKPTMPHFEETLSPERAGAIVRHLKSLGPLP
jgi:hypothetical protein